jgi:hypothetical protein
MHFNNTCNHAPDEFVGTLELVETRVEDGKKKLVVAFYDVFVCQSKTDGHFICIRYGNEGPEYLSPGTICSLLLSSGELYRRAAGLIMKKGFFTYHKYTTQDEKGGNDE